MSCSSYTFFSCLLKAFTVGNSRMSLGVLFNSLELSNESFFIALGPMFRDLKILAISCILG